VSHPDPALLVGIGGAVGALLRTGVASLADVDAFPLGTLTVNVLGSLVLGFVTAAGAGNAVVLLFGSGACGAFTTFSSFAFETVRLWETGARWRAGAAASATLVGALGALAIGAALARSLI
jgi:CrcB protein